jgi:DNA (cytosine-5)-methyltransferase 1
MDHRQYVMDHTREIDEILHFMYGTPDHNNKEDVLDELIFILLSRRTSGKGYEKAYNELKGRYPDWGKLVRARDRTILKIIGKAGLGSLRLNEIRNNLETIHERFGEYSLEHLHKWGNPKVFEFLTSLEGIGPKSAYCIMMYSLKRDVFPVDTHVNRICQRLGIIEQGMHHKVAQFELAEVFPKKYRYSLHVNMLSHGREICKSINPSCNQCVIIGFCKRNRKPHLIDNQYNFIDLFAGPGGMSLGFEDAGFNLVAAVESDIHASSSLLYNRPTLDSSLVIDRPIKDVKAKSFCSKRVQVLVAGPPCQEYSPVRQNSDRDLGRKKLYLHVLRFIREIQPLFVVIENVPGMSNRSNIKYANRVHNGFYRHGYVTISEIINARDYGIPQSRKRIFFIAKRIRWGNRKATRESVKRVWNNIHSKKQKKEVSFIEGISGIPSLKPGEGNEIMEYPSRRKLSNYALQLNNGSSILFNHISRSHNPRDLEAFTELNEGENALDLHNRRPELMIYSTDSFATKYFKIRSKTPSPTIVAHLRRDANSFIHPKDNRGITPREAARLQSFPDSYRFLGSFGIQFEQIGNAVPPLLSKMIAKSIMEEISQD